MRVGLITGEYPPMWGGVGDFTRKLALSMTDRGHDIFILTDQRGYGVPGDPIHVTASISSWDSLSIVEQWAIDWQFDVVNLQYQASAFNMSLPIHTLPALLNSRTPVVTTFHDLLGPRLPTGFEQQQREYILQVATGSSGLIMVSDWDKQALQDQITCPITHIPIGSNIENSPDVTIHPRALMGLPDSANLLGYFGFVDPRKGVEILVECLEYLGPNVHLVMIGGRSNTIDVVMNNYAGSIASLIEQRHLANRIYWTDFISENVVSAWLHAIDIVVLPFRDGLSYANGSLLASLTHGCTIVTTIPSRPLPFIQDGVQVCLVKPGDAQHMAKTIKQLLEDPARRVELSTQALKVAPEFTWSKIGEATLRFLLQF